MKDNQRYASRLAPFRCLVGAAILALVPIPLFAQETPLVLEIRVEPNKAPLPIAINLRPNVATSVGLVLQNPLADDLRGVVVKIVLPEEEKVIAQTTEVDKLGARSKVRLTFPKAKKEEKKDKAPAPDSIELPGPPFKAQIWIEAKQPQDFVTIKRDVQFIIKEPRDYITSLARFDRAKSRVNFDVKYLDGDNLTGPHQSPLHLVLGPEFADSKKGTFSQHLTKPRESVELFAEDIAFAQPNIRVGRVSVTVDNYQRAFTYPLALTGSGDLDDIPFGQKIGARIRVPRYTKPSPKFPVYLEMDGPLGADYQVEIGVDRAGMKQQFEVVKFTGLRQQKVGLAFSPAGDLLCRTKVEDWQTEFDTADIFGNIWFRVSVYKKGGLVALLIPDEYRSNVALQEAGVENKRLYARVTQDETPPQRIEFVNAPKQWLTGKPLPLTVRVRAPEAHQAPIEKKVIFFRGKAPADGKPIPPEAILGVGEFDAERSACTIVLPGLEKPEELAVSVQLMTGAGIPGAKTATITVIDAKFALAKIKGKVAHGPNGQPNLAVVLVDAGGKPKATVKTNAKGEFTFERVPPGNYVIAARVNFPALVGAAKVEVPEGKELIENVNVRLLAK